MGLLGVAGRLGLDFGAFMDDVPVLRQYISTDMG
jgi:hypothetical protein